MATGDIFEDGGRRRAGVEHHDGLVYIFHWKREEENVCVYSSVLPPPLAYPGPTSVHSLCS